MSSGQIKRKANVLDTTDNADAVKKTTKKQRNLATESSAPQFIDFDNSSNELLLPRGAFDPLQPQIFSNEQKKYAKKVTARQANEDDLFSSKKTMGDGDDDEGSEDEEQHPDELITNLKKSKHDMTKSQVKAVEPRDGTSTVKTAHHLTSATVQPGQIFLATVANITPFELKVTLPDGISGSISYREVSDTLTAMIDSQLEACMEDPTQVQVSALRDMDILAHVPSLDQLFTIGQQITPMIIKVVDKPHSKTMKQKIFCSLRPSVVNAQYKQSLSLLPACGVPIMGDVESIEAKGYVIQYGLPFNGFVPFSDKITAETYQKGALVTTLLPKDKQITPNDRTVQVTLDTTKILHHTIGVKAEISFEQIRAGQFYHGMVSKHLSDGGLVVQILGDFSVSVSALQLPPTANNTHYPVLSKVIVRITATQQTRTGESKISGTLHRDLISPQSLYQPNIDFTKVAQLGDIKRVKVVKMISNKALMVQFLHDAAGEQIPQEYYTHITDEQLAKRAATAATTPILGWLPLRSCADVALTDFPKQFKVGATITVRVIGFNYLDCFIQLTAKPSLLQAQALAYSDMIPGQKYNGIVIKTLFANQKEDKIQKKTERKKERPTTINNGIILQISPTITAFIPLSQLTNQGTTTNNAAIAKKFAIGSKHSCIILVSEPEQKKLIATTKPALLDRNGQDEVFGSYAHAKDVFQLYQSRQQPLLLGGYIDRCTDNFVVVRFYNNIVGVITKAMLVQQGLITETQTPEFAIGEYILSRVLNVYDDKLSLSLAINVSQQDQDKLIKLTAQPQATKSTTSAPASTSATSTIVKKTPFELATRPGFLITNLRIMGQNDEKNAIKLQFTLADKDYNAILPKSQLSDHIINQPLIYKKLTTPSGSGDYPTLPVAMVLGFDQQDADNDKIVLVSIKLSHFIMYTAPELIPTVEIPSIFFDKKKAAEAAGDLLKFLSIIAEKVQGSTSALTTKPLPIPFSTTTGPYIGSVETITDEASTKVLVTNAFGAYIHKTKLFDTINRDNAQTLTPTTALSVGQPILFSVAPTTTTTTSTTQYQSKLSQIVKAHGPSFIQRWVTYLKASSAFEAQYLKTTDNYQVELESNSFPAGFALGNVLTNAKVSKFENDVVQFTTTASTKSKVVLKCTNVEYHAPEITEATIGSSMDVVIIGYGEESTAPAKKTKAAAPVETTKVLYVSTLPTLIPSTKTIPASIPESLIGTVVNANIIHKSQKAIVVALPDHQQALMTITPTHQPNTTKFTPFFDNVNVGSAISVLINTTTQAIFIGLGKAEVPMKSTTTTTTELPTIAFAPNTFFNTEIKSTTDLTINTKLNVKIDGLYDIKDGKKLDVKQFASIDDLRRYEIKCAYGPTTAAVPSVKVTIPLSALIDPSVPEQPKKAVVAKKGAKATKAPLTIAPNVLTTLTQLTTTALVPSTIIATQPSANKKTPSVINVSIRETDLRGEDYRNRQNINLYKNPDQSIHNAIVLKVSPIVGIMAQITPKLQVHIQPDACGVTTVEKVGSDGQKKQRLKAIDFDAVQSAIKVGDLITFRVLAPETIFNTTQLLDGALVHTDLNPNGVSAVKVKAPAVLTTTTTPQPKLPTIPRAVVSKNGTAYSIGDIVNGAKIIAFVEKSSMYQISLPNGSTGTITLVELVEPQVLAKMDAESLANMYKEGDVISQIIILSARVGMSYICSARTQRRAALLSGTGISSTTTAQNIVAELQQAAKSDKVAINISPNAVSTTTPSTKMSDEDDMAPLPILGGLTVDTLTPCTFVPGQLIAGVITNIAPQGLFVQVSALQSGQVTYSDLTDYYTDAKTIAKSGLYKVGQPLVVAVKSVEPSTQKLALIAKPSVTNLNDAILLNAMKPGAVVTGTVKQVNATGVWVLIKPSTILTGFSHSTNCVDNKKTDYQSYYKIGDKVKAVILKVDTTTKRITIGLKASLFTRLDKLQNNDDELAALAAAAESSDDSDDDRDDDSDNSTTMNDEDKIVLSQQQKQLNISATREQSILSSLFSVLGGDAPLLAADTKKKTATTKKSAAATADDEELIDFSILDSQSSTTPLSVRLATTIKATAGKDSTERKIELLEHALAGIGDNSLLSTIQDTQSTGSVTEFELRCAAQPNNAAVWIGYMAFQLQNNEIQKARDICTQALKIIAVSSIDQRWMMYSSLLSIEILYGTVTSLEHSMSVALKEFEKVKVYSEVGRIAISSQKFPLAIDYYTKALRSTGLAQDAESNMNKSRQVLTNAQETYIALISLLFAQQKRTEAQALLKTAIKQLPAAYTSLVITKTILLEYQSDHGSIENGRVMFQMFLKDHPKRIDVWMTWLQQEIKLCKQMHKLVKDGANAATGNKNQTNFKQQKTRIRELFDIFTTKSANVYNITWSTLKPAQVKLIYSLAIDFENSPMCQGDSRTDTIKNRAQIYVEEVSK